MGFLEFLTGAVKILIGGAVFLFAIFGGTMFVAYGHSVIGGILLVVGLVGGLYAQYEPKIDTPN